jgi:tRNA dimethylallyltransferase
MTSDCSLLVIVGPTASGKTSLAIELAERMNGEIICADSRTVYRGLDIGTAKPTPEERARVPHHLLDVVDPDEPFSVANFKKHAERAIADIRERGKLPVLVGGSGLYIDAITYDYQFSAAGMERSEQNPRHLAVSGDADRQTLLPGAMVIGLEVSRDVLRQRVTDRVEVMVERGFADEVQWLTEHYPDSKALDAPGYKAFREYLGGHKTLEEAKADFVRNDMQLAKRQMTWFRRNKSIHWLDGLDPERAEAVSLLIDTMNTGRNANIIGTP